MGEGVDSLIFYPLAFLGAAGWTTRAGDHGDVHPVGAQGGWEVVLTPVTYAVVGFLKRREGVDVFDRGTDFSPFHTGV